MLGVFDDTQSIEESILIIETCDDCDTIQMMGLETFN